MMMQLYCSENGEKKRKTKCKNKIHRDTRISNLITNPASTEKDVNIILTLFLLDKLSLSLSLSMPKLNRFGEDKFR